MANPMTLPARSYRSDASSIRTILFILSKSLLNPNYQPQIKEQKRRGEKQAVDQIERATNPRKKISRVFDTRAPFQDRLGKIADHRGKSEEQSKDGRMRPGQHGQMLRHQFEQHQAAKGRERESAKKPFPGFFRANLGRHLMPAHRASR